MSDYKSTNYVYDIKTLRKEMFLLNRNLNKYISLQLKRNDLDDKLIAASSKLIDNFVKLVKAQQSGKLTFLEKENEVLNKDEEMILRIYKEEIMAPRAGLEPATERLTAACSTTELPRNYRSVKS